MTDDKLRAALERWLDHWEQLDDRLDGEVARTVVLTRAALAASATDERLCRNCTHAADLHSPVNEQRCASPGCACQGLDLTNRVLLSGRAASATDEPDLLRASDRTMAEYSDDRSACPRCGEWRDNPTADCAACGYAASATDEEPLRRGDEQRGPQTPDRCTECGVPYAAHPLTDACAIAQESRDAEAFLARPAVPALDVETFIVAYVTARYPDAPVGWWLTDAGRAVRAADEPSARRLYAALSPKEPTE